MRLGLRTVIFFIAISALFVYIIGLFLPYSSQSQRTSFSTFSNLSLNQKKKIILSWTKFFGILLDDKYFDACPELRRNCTITVDRNRHKDADAIVFHLRDMQWSDLPPSRTPDQRYLFLMHESPFHTCFDMDLKPNFFNWSFTYRLDSDIPYPYTYLSHMPSERQELQVDVILNKSTTHAPIVWFASNCAAFSKRELYVKALQKYIDVDVYGACGPLKCPKAIDGGGYIKVSKCEDYNRYRFYIAFENSICKDYITEKFYGRRQYNSVPIVLSRTVAEPLLPPKSFIAIDDFPDGPAQLANYLRYLMTNDTAYLEYFHWKTVGYGWTSRNPSTGIQFGFCGICEKLWQLEREGTTESKSYAAPSSWWGVKASCDVDLVPRLIAKELKKDPTLAELASKPSSFC